MLIPMASFAQTAQQKYIETYAELAVQEMYRSGVPASITLAQGMLNLVMDSRNWH
jgi:flagellum-specific peptidoglycan hydrolase FlgJ